MSMPQLGMPIILRGGRLVMASSVLPTRSSGRYGEYYRACRARGMGHGRALKAVARRRLRAIYAVMRDRVPYRE